MFYLTPPHLFRQQSGLVKAIGLSNFTIEDYEELMASPGVRVEPVVNQIEINPLIYRSMEDTL